MPSTTSTNRSSHRRLPMTTKAENYYLLANHFFDQENFVQAKILLRQYTEFYSEEWRATKGCFLLVANLSEIAKTPRSLFCKIALSGCLNFGKRKRLADTNENANKPKLAEIPGPSGKKFPRLGNRVDDIRAPGWKVDWTISTNKTKK